jgi:hypothetical protein
MHPGAGVCMCGGSVPICCMQVLCLVRSIAQSPRACHSLMYSCCYVDATGSLDHQATQESTASRPKDAQQL